MPRKVDNPGGDMREQTLYKCQLSGHTVVAGNQLQGLEFARLVGEKQEACIVWGNHGKFL